MASRVFGIDFGTDSVKIFRKGAGLIYFQKTALAVKNNKNVIAIGNEAFEMYGKAPEKIEIFFPIKAGAVASFEKMQSLVNCIFLDLSREYGRIRSPEIYLAVSSDLSDLEKKAFYDSVESSFVRPRKVKMIDKPIADAVGCGIDYNNCGGMLLCNVGCETTEVTVLYKGTIVISRLFKFGGKDIDEALAAYIKNTYKLRIGEKAAELCKRNVTDLDMGKKSDKVYGMHVMTSLPKVCSVNSDEIRNLVIDKCNTIIDAIKNTIERIPPEITSDIMNNGMVLSGGTAKIPGIADIIEEGINLVVRIPENPTDTVISGLGRIAEEKYTIEQEV